MPRNTHKRSLRVYALQGRHTLLIWCRDSRNDWRSELVDGKAPQTVSGTVIDMDRYELSLAGARVRSFNPWNGKWSVLEAEGNSVVLPAFQRSIVLRVDLRP